MTKEIFFYEKYKAIQGLRFVAFFFVFLQHAGAFVVSFIDYDSSYLFFHIKK